MKIKKSLVFHDITVSPIFSHPLFKLFFLFTDFHQLVSKNPHIRHKQLFHHSSEN